MKSFIGICCFIILISNAACIEGHLNEEFGGHGFGARRLPLGSRSILKYPHIQNWEFFNPFLKYDGFNMHLYKFKDAKKAILFNQQLKSNSINVKRNKKLYVQTNTLLMEDLQKVSTVKATQNSVENWTTSPSPMENHFTIYRNSLGLFKESRNADSKTLSTRFNKMKSSMGQNDTLGTDATSSPYPILLKNDSVLIFLSTENKTSSKSNSEMYPGDFSFPTRSVSKYAQINEDSNIILSDKMQINDSTVSPSTDSTISLINDTSDRTSDPPQKGINDVNDSKGLELKTETEVPSSTNKKMVSYTDIYSSSTTNSSVDITHPISNSKSSFLTKENTWESTTQEFDSFSGKKSSHSSDFEQTSKNTAYKSTLTILHTTIDTFVNNSLEVTSSSNGNISTTNSITSSNSHAELTRGRNLTRDLGSTTAYVIPKSKIDQTTEGSYTSISKETIYTEVEDKSEVISEPEHDIKISSIKTVKMVVSVVFLIIALVATAVLTIYMIKIKRKEVQYDQLTLLP